MTPETDNIPAVYYKLRQHLDRMPVPMPRTDSGVELRLLRQLFSEEEARIALELSVFPEPATKIHARLRDPGISLSMLEHVLIRLYRKGSIRGVRQRRKDKVRYLFGKLPMVVGMFEFQVDRITGQFAADFFEYEREALGQSLMEARTKQMRTVPVNIPVDPCFQIGNYDDIVHIVKNAPGPFGVMNCVCRQAKDRTGHPCKQSDIRETCLLLGGSVHYMKELGVCREVTRKDMLEHLKQAKKAGFVLQPENTRDPAFICCCCGCCCGVLSMAKYYDKPAEHLHSNFFARIDQDACDGCATCARRCQMEALRRPNSSGTMQVDRDRCIGCGACVPTCKEKAIALCKKEREYVPPRTSRDLYVKMTVQRYGLWKTALWAGKGLAGHKV
jgi:NAD-dependent dihydropyrimidine dehydrogenase PreA subunit